MQYLILQQNVLRVMVVMELALFASAAPGNETIAEPGLKPTGEGKRLLAAILAEDDKAFNQAIEDSADPNEFIGKYDTQWAMCVATQVGKERFLERLIEVGGDPDLHNPYDSSTEAPTTCTLVNGNIKAFNILVAAGAEPNRVDCSGCLSSSQTSLYLSALQYGNFDIGLRMLDLVTPTHEDMLDTKRILEYRGTYQSELTEGLAAYVRSRGISVTLPPE